MIPAFAHGRTSSSLDPSAAHRAIESDKDSTFYWDCEFMLASPTCLHTEPTDRFVDRAMFAGFRGGGIGHKTPWDTLADINKEFHDLFEEDGRGDPMIDGSGLSDENSDESASRNGASDSGSENEEKAKMVGARPTLRTATKQTAKVWALRMVRSLGKTF